MGRDFGDALNTKVWNFRVNRVVVFVGGYAGSVEGWSMAGADNRCTVGSSIIVRCEIEFSRRSDVDWV